MAHGPAPRAGTSAEGSNGLDQMRRTVEEMGLVGQAPPAHDAVMANWQRLVDDYLEFLQRYMSNPELPEEQKLRLSLTTDVEEERKQRNQLANLVRDRWLKSQAGMGERYFGKLVNDLYDELVGLSVLAPLWRDPEVTEILVDGWNKISYERNGRLYSTDLSFRSPKHAETVARSLAETVSDRALSRSNPLVTARIPNSRIAFAYGEVAQSGLYIALRKHHGLLRVEDLLNRRAMTPEMAEFLRRCVLARANILISGGTGAGKTTVINALSSFIPDSERVITIEDSFELELQNNHWVALQAKEAASADDTVRVTIADLLRQTLRMRPDRIVVGEVRDGEAAETLLEAANTGHDGTMTTVHANGAWDAINSRIVTLYQRDTGVSTQVARAEVSRAFELVVHVARRQGKRFIGEIAEVGQVNPTTGEIELRTLYAGKVVDDEVIFTKGEPVNPQGDLARKLIDSGVVRERSRSDSEKEV